MEIQLAAPLGNFDRPSERLINRRAIGKNLKICVNQKFTVCPLHFAMAFLTIFKRSQRKENGSIYSICTNWAGRKPR